MQRQISLLDIVSGELFHWRRCEDIGTTVKLFRPTDGLPCNDCRRVLCAEQLGHIRRPRQNIDGGIVMPRLNFAALFACTVLLCACGKPTFSAKDPDSLEAMMRGMSTEQKALFLRDVELAAVAHGDEYKLNGADVEQIREWATNVRENVRKENIVFLRNKIDEMSAKGQDSASIHTNAIGVLSNPKVGFLPKTRSLEYLRKQLAALESQSSGAALQPEAATPASEPRSNQGGQGGQLCWRRLGWRAGRQGGVRGRVHPRVFREWKAGGRLCFSRKSELL